ncbi:type II secretion system protein K [Kordiimonas sediminis]|uniref:Type II secretion system protein K n=1 Tax=Kordiimonas sediminis TaxID=1735581 RepID=A0A919AN76_9PROT|nr:type II secretion system minor pseudopilin GspK [Kordiimonas sediminis]GHF17323.1 type II secretion system protein K [Kordiimonas sediminis]
MMSRLYTRLFTQSSGLLREDGAALVTVMLLVAMMSSVAVIAFDQIGAAVRSVTAETQKAQAKRYALGGEVLAQDMIGQIADLPVAMQSVEQSVSYPVSGGAISGSLQDASNCFNINSLVTRDGRGGFSADQRSAEEYGRLLQSLGITGTLQMTLVSSLVDWMDTDRQPGPLGAEDAAYSALPEPYRAANTPMVDVSEIRLVKGYTKALQSQLLPYLCVGEIGMPAPYNLQSMQAHHTPILMSLLGDRITQSEAQQLITRHGGAGRTDHISSFWRDDAFRNIEISQQTRTRLGLIPTRFGVRITVSYGDVTLGLRSEFLQTSGGAVKLVSRRYMGGAKA